MAHIIEDEDMEIEIEESEHSEHSEHSEVAEGNLELVNEASKSLTKAEMVKHITFCAKMLAQMEISTSKTPRLQSSAQLKARAWEQWVLNRCNRDGWDEFTHESKVNGKVTHYAGAGLAEDGKIVFCDTGKAFMNKHAKIYASLVRNSDWYTEFESEYVPSEAPTAVVKAKMTEEERAAEKARKTAEAAQKREEKRLAAAAAKQAEKERILEEKRLAAAAEEAKKKEQLSKIRKLLQPMGPVVKSVAAAAVAAPVKTVPKPALAKVAAPAAPAAPVPLAKKVTWVKPENGEMGEFEVGGKKFWRDGDDYLFENNHDKVGDFVGQFNPKTGKIDDTVPNPFE
jgi:hypothetical protein